MGWRGKCIVPVRTWIWGVQRAECYRLTRISSNWYTEVLNPRSSEGRSLKEVMGVKLRPVGWVLIHSELCHYRRKCGDTHRVRISTCTEGTVWEDRVGRWPSGSRGHVTKNYTCRLTPWSWTSCLHNCGKNTRCLSHPKCSILLPGISVKVLNLQSPPVRWLIVCIPHRGLVISPQILAVKTLVNVNTADVWGFTLCSCNFWPHTLIPDALRS